jgi:hypothetical protein
MENFNFKKYLAEGKLLKEVELMANGDAVIIPDNLKIPVIDYDEATDKDIDTGKTIGAVELKKGIEELTSEYGSHYKVDLNPGLEYAVYYPDQDKSDYIMRFKFKQVGDKLEVDPTSVTAEMTNKD